MEDVVLTDAEIAAQNEVIAAQNEVIAAQNEIKAKEIFDALNIPVVVEEAPVTDSPVVDETPTV